MTFTWHPSNYGVITHIEIYIYIYKLFWRVLKVYYGTCKSLVWNDNATIKPWYFGKILVGHLKGEFHIESKMTTIREPIIY